VKKHLKKRNLETWPTKEREARFILRSLAAKISKRKRHDTTRHNSTRHDTRRHTHTRTEGTGTHNKKGANDKNRNYEMYIPKLLQNTKKQFQKTSKNLPKSIKNQSKMSPGAPPETPRARDLFLRPFLMFFGPKWTPKWSQKRSKRYVFVCLFFRCRFTSIFKRKIITFGVLVRLILMIFATFDNHENDAPVQARASI